MTQQGKRLFSSGLLKKTFDRLPWGIIKANREQEITYADRQMCEIAGTDALEGRKIRDLFPDDKNYSIVTSQLKKRFIEQRANEYEVELTRLNDKVKVPISITAFPDIDQQGHVIESVGIVQSLVLEKATKEIHRYIEDLRDGEKILRSVAQEVYKLVPFDAFRIILFSTDKRNYREFFTYSGEGKTESQVRWWEMKPSIRKLVEREGSQIFNLPELVNQPESAELCREINTEKFLREGFQSSLFYPVRREGRSVASITLSRKNERAFSEEEKKKIEALPLSEAILMTLHYEEIKHLNFTIELGKKLSSARDVRGIADVFVQEISKHYQWDIVSIYQVDEKRGEIRLLSQQERKLLLNKEYTQRLDSGVLGYVYKNKKGVNIGDVRSDPKFKDIFLEVYPDTISELCLPIFTNYNVCWLLNVEDSRKNAFAEQEKEALEYSLSEVSRLLENSLRAQLLTEVLRSAQDAIISTDSTGKITKVNPAAEKLLGYTKEEMKGTSLSAYLKDREVATALLEFRQISSDELKLLDKEGREINVLLSSASLPREVGGGKVYMANDLSLRKRVERLETLYREIAIQIKTPLSLAFSWLRRLRKGETGKTAEVLNETLKQLHKVDLTFDRLLLYDHDRRLIPYNTVLLDISYLIESIKKGMPSSEAAYISIESEQNLPSVLGDMHQISFCIETILSYLMRFVPEEGKINVKISRRDSRIVIVISGYEPEFKQTKSYIDDSWIVRTSKEIALAKNVLKAFIEEDNKGRFCEPKRCGKEIEFRIELLAVEEGEEGNEQS